MHSNLLAWFKIDLGEGAFDAVFGFLFVFLGIAFLVGIFTLLGLIMKKVNARRPKQKKVKHGKTIETPPKESIDAEEETLSPEIIAVITAAIAAVYEAEYESENIPCDFVVRRIKKL